MKYDESDEKKIWALVGVAQSVRASSHNRKVMGSISDWGHAWVVGPIHGWCE